MNHLSAGYPQRSTEIACSLWEPLCPSSWNSQSDSCQLLDDSAINQWLGAEKWRLGDIVLLQLVDKTEPTDNNTIMQKRQKYGY